MKKRQPGNPCCDDPCVIVRDSLAGPDLSTTFDLMAGDWDDSAIVDGYVRWTGIAEIWHKTPHPDSPYPPDVRVKVRGAADSVLRIILSASGDVATGDALIVELAPGTDCGTLKLYQRLDGVEDLLANTSVYGAAVDEWHDLRACYDPDTAILTGSILAHDQDAWRQLSVEVENHDDGEYAGVATGTADQSDFDTFVFRKLWYDEVITPLCCELTIVEIQKGREATDYFTQNISFVFPIPEDSGLSVSFPGGYSFSGTYLTGTSFTDIDSLLADLNDFLAANGLDGSFEGTCSAGSGGADVVITYYGPLTPTWSSYGAGVSLGPSESGTLTAQNELQTITVTTQGTQQFTLTYGGQTTGMLSTTSSAATVQAALEALSSIGTGNVSVTGSWVVEFTGTLAETDVEMLTWESVGTCLDYGTYYQPETVRHVCSTCDPPGCSWAEGHFDDPDSLCEWLDPTDDWTIADGALQTTEADAELFHSAMRTGTKEETASCTFKVSAKGAGVSLVLRFDADNYAAVAVTPATDADELCGTITLSVVTDGSPETWETHTIPYLVVDDDITLRIKIDGSVVIADVSSDAGAVSWQSETSTAIDWTTVNAGVSVTGNTGTVYFSSFEAGCNPPARTCEHEGLSLTYADGIADWRKGVWNKLSGTWPTWDDSTLVYECLKITAPIAMLSENPIPDMFKQSHRIRFGFDITDYDLEHDTYLFGVLFGCDEAGQNGWEARISLLSGVLAVQIVKITAGAKAVVKTMASVGEFAPGSPFCCIDGGRVWLTQYGKFGDLTAGAIDYPGTAAGPYWGVDVETWTSTAGKLFVCTDKSDVIGFLGDTPCPGCRATCDQCIDQFPAGFVVEVDGIGTLAFSERHVTTLWSSHTGLVVPDASYYVYASALYQCMAQGTYAFTTAQTACHTYTLTGDPLVCTEAPEAEATYCTNGPWTVNVSALVTTDYTKLTGGWSGVPGGLPPDGSFYVYVEVTITIPWWGAPENEPHDAHRALSITVLYRIAHDAEESCTWLGASLEYVDHTWEHGYGTSGVLDEYPGDYCTGDPTAYVNSVVQRMSARLTSL